MSGYLSLGAIEVKDIRLWAHVGVLEQERISGQLFSLDFKLWLELDEAAQKDDLSASADYSLAISDIHQLCFELRCLTIEHFSEKILDCLDRIYGPVPMKVFLRKCSPPIPGFSGSVAVERRRNWSFE